MAAADVYDGKVLEKPNRWDGDKKRWKHWSARVRGFVRATNIKLANMMQIATQQKETLSHEGWGDEEVALDAKLHSIFTGILDGNAMDQLLSAEEGHGLEFWRQACKDNEPKTIGHNRTRLTALLMCEGLDHLPHRPWRPLREGVLTAVLFWIS